MDKEHEVSLVAAAPDMLHALESTMEYWETTGFADDDCDPGCGCVVCLSRAAIKKAKGEA